MDIGFIKSWIRRLGIRTKKKLETHSYIHFLAFLKIGFKIAYRTLQVIVRGLSDYIKVEMHIRTRILKVKPQLNPGNVEPVTLIVDASGLKVSNKGDYIEEKWIRKKKQRSYLLVVFKSKP
jgi:hypothetical protein